MKTKSFLTILTTLALVCGASVAFEIARTEFGGSRNPLPVDELQTITAAAQLKAKAVRLSVLLDGVKDFQHRALEIKLGQQAVLEVIREFRYPTEFDAAAADPKTKAITPTTPTTFEVTNTGYTMQFDPSLKGPFVALSGKFLSVTFEGFTQNAGEIFRPIADNDGKVVSENHARTPMFTTRTTPFYALLTPGKESAFSVLTENGIKRVTLKCEVVP